MIKAGVMILLLIIITSLANAQTLVLGNIYNQSFSNPIAADVKVVCNHSGNLIIRNINSLSDGIYAVLFADNECSINDKINVSASYKNLRGSETSPVYDSGFEPNFLVINVVMKFFGLNAPEIQEKCDKTARKIKVPGYCGDNTCQPSIGEDSSYCPEDCGEEQTIIAKNIQPSILELTPEKQESNNLLVPILLELLIISTSGMIVLVLLIKR